jgi:hypothetical protein
MACWVVPAIAAELWGVSVNHVLAGMRDGTIASRYEHGFLCVDAVPGSYTYHRPRRPDESPLPTYVLVRSEDESCAPVESSLAEALSEESSSEELSVVPVPVAEDEELPPLDVEEDDTPLPPRDAIRAAVARQRRRPLAA